MKVTSYAVARPAYYDRNSATSFQAYDNTVSPHNYTVRWTTTVAAGKKLLVESSYTEVSRSTTATIAGIYYGRISVGSVYINSVISSSNVLNAVAVVPLVSAVTVYAAEAIVGATSDQSTGGTLYFNVAYKGTLYDS